MLNMKKLLRLIMSTVFITLLAVGCSKENSTKTAGNGAETVQEAADTPYTYVDAAGREVVIDKEPVRIATDYLPLWETLLLLDITPVAASGADNYLATWDPFQELDMGEVIDLGSSEVNLELLLEVAPDVFLSQAADPGNIDVSNFEKISPVAVYGPETKMDWRLSLREVGKLVGREEKAEEVIADFDNKIADARSRLEEKYAGQTVFQMSLMDADKYYCAYRSALYSKKTGLGLTPPEGYTISENYEQVSMEAIVAMDPDYIFVNVFAGDEALFEELTNNSVWNSLKAVKAGHVVKLDGAGHATSGLAMQYTINKIVDILLAE